MVRAGIAYTDAGHARIMALASLHNIGIVELFESMAFADDDMVRKAIEQGLPRRKAAMAESKAAKKAINDELKKSLKGMSPAQVLELLQSRQANG